MLAVERRQAVLTAVRAHGAASIRQLARLAGVSEVTVRRDLRLLEESGHVVRHHGGAVVAGGIAHEPSYSDKSHVAAPEKAAIAERAATLVDDGDAVVLGAGTTTEALARRLTGLRELTVVTPSLLVAQALTRSPGIEVHVTGGALRGSIHAMVGGATEQALAGLRTPKAFLSGNGLTTAHGLSTPNMLVARVDRAIAAAAEQVIVLADHTKIGADTMVQTVPATRISVLVTDDGADASELEGLRGAGVRVLVAAAS